MVRDLCLLVCSHRSCVFDGIGYVDYVTKLQWVMATLINPAWRRFGSRRRFPSVDETCKPGTLPWQLQMKLLHSPYGMIGPIY